ncbi:uncharacterized protein LOC104584982 [Brachypodium distachyon]|uniref:uncharacterized protein LOC104584982 n=1 Tax=Brachypodium distachyon TaxID=15368 RepID=UPI00052FE4A2|nr:uncharacterized protein LOC104584982 [Brachypodium distachyon]|eukprot:XP_010239153.1 uncharacterized protein LOC104584982 [Brachypodium distachyon]
MPRTDKESAAESGKGGQDRGSARPEDLDSDDSSLDVGGDSGSCWRGTRTKTTSPWSSRKRGQASTSPAAPAKKPRPTSGGGDKDAADVAVTAAAAAARDTRVPDPSLQGTGPTRGVLRAVAGDVRAAPAPNEVREINVTGEVDDDAPEEVASAGDATAAAGSATQTAPSAASDMGQPLPAEACSSALEKPLSPQPAPLRLCREVGELETVAATAAESSARLEKELQDQARSRECELAGQLKAAQDAGSSLQGECDMAQQELWFIDEDNTNKASEIDEEEAKTHWEAVQGVVDEMVARMQSKADEA